MYCTVWRGLCDVRCRVCVTLFDIFLLCHLLLHLTLLHQQIIKSYIFLTLSPSLSPSVAAQQARRRDKQVKIAMDKLKQEKDARDLIEKEINDKLAEERRLQKLEDDKNAAQAARDAIINNPKLNYFNSISFSTPAPAPGTFDYLSPLPVDGISPTASTVPPTVNSSISPISLTASWLEKVTTSEKGLYMENAMPTEMKLCPMSAEQVI
jgi:hypothetical protein